MTILVTNDYKTYVNDPTDDDFTRKARDLFNAKPLKAKNGESILNVP